MTLGGTVVVVVVRGMPGARNPAVEGGSLKEVVGTG